MLTFQTVVFAVLLFGIVLIIFSIILFARDNQHGHFGNTSDNTIKAIDVSISEMDKTMDEFSNMTKNIFEELDQRYQELLFLYSLIDDKKNTIENMHEPPPVSVIAQPLLVKPEPKIEAATNSQAILSHPRRGDIIKLRRQGLPISEIAKQLNMGQGEVKLIIELGKAR